MTISIIVAMSPNHAIGYKGALPWHLPEDLAHFKRLTMGHAIIMGRRTFLSLPNGPLPGRHNIVLSRNKSLHPDMGNRLSPDTKHGTSHPYKMCRTLEEALAECKDDTEVFIIGGAEIYRQALPLAGKMYITLVGGNPAHADAFFPAFNKEEWQETKKEKHDGFSFIELVRATP